MSEKNNLVCPVALAGGLDNRIRRWFHDPRQILEPYVGEGMTALDVGCGPGFFTLEMAALVGSAGHVIAADLQDGMLDRIRKKIRGSEIEARITLHKCGERSIGVTEPVDFALAFWMVHEVPDRKRILGEIASILKPGGRTLIAEPPIHVSRRSFEETIAIAREAGLTPAAGPKIFFSRTALLHKPAIVA